MVITKRKTHILSADYNHFSFSKCKDTTNNSIEKENYYVFLIQITGGYYNILIKNLFNLSFLPLTEEVHALALIRKRTFRCDAFHWWVLLRWW